MFELPTLLSKYWHKLSGRNHIHLFWLPIILYFCIGTAYYQANMGGSGTELPINLVGWTALSVSLSFGLVHLYKTKKIKTNLQIWLLGGAVLGLFVPFLYGESEPQASTYYRFIALPLIWLFILLSLQFRVTQRNRNALIVFLFIGICVQLAIACAQLFLMNTPQKPFGHFQQTNLMGSYLMTGYACVFYLLQHFHHKSKFLKNGLASFYILICFLMGFVVAELESRGALLAGGAISLLFVLQFLRCRRFSPLIFCISFISGLFAASFLSEGEQAISVTLEQFQSKGEREVLYPQVLQLISDNTLIGVGYGKFEAAYTRYSAEQAKLHDNLDLVQHNMDHPHNELMYWFVEGGAVAGIIVVVFFLSLLYSLLCRLRWRKIAHVALFLPIGLHVLTEYPLYASFPHLLTFLLLFRLFILKPAKHSRPIPLRLSLLLRPLAMLFSCVGILFSITGLHTISLVLAYELRAGKTPEPYTSIINPFVHYDRYWSNIMAHKARAAIQYGDRVGMLGYVAWAERTIQLHPKKVYFENVIRIKYSLNILQSKECERYEFYFPKQTCSELLNEKSYNQHNEERRVSTP